MAGIHLLPIGVADCAKNFANRTRANCDDQHIRLLDGAVQVGLDRNRVTLFQITKLAWIAIMHEQAVSASSPVADPPASPM